MGCIDRWDWQRMDLDDLDSSSVFFALELKSEGSIV